MSVGCEGLVEVVALGDGEVQHHVEIGWNFVEVSLGEIDADGLHALGVPRCAGVRILESGRSVHGVACRSQGFGQRAGNPSRDSGDEDLLSGDRFHDRLLHHNWSVYVSVPNTVFLNGAVQRCLASPLDSRSAPNRP